MTFVKGDRVLRRTGPNQPRYEGVVDEDQVDPERAYVWVKRNSDGARMCAPAEMLTLLSREPAVPASDPSVPVIAIRNGTPASKPIAYRLRNIRRGGYGVYVGWEGGFQPITLDSGPPASPQSGWSRYGLFPDKDYTFLTGAVVSAIEASAFLTADPTAEDAAYKRGRDSGYDQGYKTGHRDGEAIGKITGRGLAHGEGYERGKKAGIRVGRTQTERAVLRAIRANLGSQV